MLRITEAQALADTLTGMAAEPHTTVSAFECSYCGLSIETAMISGTGDYGTLSFAEHVMFGHTGRADVVQVSSTVIITTRPAPAYESTSDNLH